MRISAQDIRNKDFERKFKGYDNQDVDAFLQSLSTEWEKLVSENGSFGAKHEKILRENSKLKEIEASLLKTISEFKKSGPDAVKNAQKSASIYIRDAKASADRLILGSNQKARNIVGNAHKEALKIIQKLKKALSEMESAYNSLAGQRDRLVGELSTLAFDIHNRLDRSNKRYEAISIEKELQDVNQLEKDIAGIKSLYYSLSDDLVLTGTPGDSSPGFAAPSYSEGPDLATGVEGYGESQPTDPKQESSLPEGSESFFDKL